MNRYEAVDDLIRMLEELSNRSTFSTNDVISVRKSVAKVVIIYSEMLKKADSNMFWLSKINGQICKSLPVITKILPDEEFARVCELFDIDIYSAIALIDDSVGEHSKLFMLLEHAISDPGKIYEYMEVNSSFSFLLDKLMSIDKSNSFYEKLVKSLFEFAEQFAIDSGLFGISQEEYKQLLASNPDYKLCLAISNIERVLEEIVIQGARHINRRFAHLDDEFSKLHCSKFIGSSMSILSLRNLKYDGLAKLANKIVENNLFESYSFIHLCIREDEFGIPVVQDEVEQILAVENGSTALLEYMLEGKGNNLQCPPNHAFSAVDTLPSFISMKRIPNAISVKEALANMVVGRPASLDCFFKFISFFSEIGLQINENALRNGVKNLLSQCNNGCELVTLVTRLSHAGYSNLIDREHPFRGQFPDLTQNGGEEVLKDIFTHINAMLIVFDAKSLGDSVRDFIKSKKLNIRIPDELVKIHGGLRSMRLADDLTL